MSICPKNRSSRARRDKRRANWKMDTQSFSRCSKCGALVGSFVTAFFFYMRKE
jgi:large subunit ribosomal protein L32